MQSKIPYKIQRSTHSPTRSTMPQTPPYKRHWLSYLKRHFPLYFPIYSPMYRPSYFPMHWTFPWFNHWFFPCSRQRFSPCMFTWNMVQNIQKSHPPITPQSLSTRCGHIHAPICRVLCSFFTSYFLSYFLSNIFIFYLTFWGRGLQSWAGFDGSGGQSSPAETGKPTIMVLGIRTVRCPLRSSAAIPSTHIPQGRFQIGVGKSIQPT